MKRKPQKPKSTLTIIGAGRLGTAVALALSRGGYSIKTLVGRRLAKTKKSAALLDAHVQVLTAKQLAKLELAEITIIATPDDEIDSVVSELAELAGSSTVLHTSGALSSDVLSVLTKKGFHTGSIHPLISVSDPETGANSFQNAYWCVEGDPQAVRTAKSMIRDMGGRSFSINPKVKPLYHAAAVMAAGNVVALFDVAIEMLEQCGLQRLEARQILLPLLESTVTNLRRSDTSKALTGTFSRGDIATVQRHLRALSENKPKEALTLYRLLGLRSLKLSERNGLQRDVVDRLGAELK